MKKFISIMILVFSITACSEEPASVVRAKDDKPEEVELTEITLQALKYEGRLKVILNLPTGPQIEDVGACSFFLGVDASDADDARYFAKSDFSLHSKTIRDSQLRAYAYSFTQNKYSDLESKAQGAAPVLTSITLDEKSEIASQDADPNLIKQYEDEGVYLQSLLVEFSEGFEMASFSEDVESVTKVTARIWHDNHPDSGTCDFADPKAKGYVGMEEVTFKLVVDEQSAEEEEGHEHEEEGHEGHDH